MTMKKEEITQMTMLEWFLPILRENGKFYNKTQQVVARKAVEGEHIATITQDGLETTNIADADDYVVKNLTNAGEQYIVDKQAFKKRYDLVKDLGNGLEQYNPVSQVIALELTDVQLLKLELPVEFYFLAAWGEPMRTTQGDFLACPPDFSEIYRVARNEFFQTYALA